jgi:hypothetical protein
LLAAVGTFSCLWLAQSVGVAQTLSATQLTVPTPRYREDQILIRPKPGISLATLANCHATQKSEVVRTFDGIGSGIFGGDHAYAEMDRKDPNSWGLIIRM